MINSADDRNWQNRQWFSQRLQHPFAQGVCGDAFQQIEKASWFVIEPTENDVLDSGLGQSHDRLDRSGCELGVHHDGKRWKLPPQTFEHFDFDHTTDRRIGDDDVRRSMRNSSVQFRPCRYRYEQMLRPENDLEMRNQLTREKRDDVQVSGVPGLGAYS